MSGFLSGCPFLRSNGLTGYSASYSLSPLLCLALPVAHHKEVLSVTRGALQGGARLDLGV